MSIPVTAPPRVLERLRRAADGPLPLVHTGPHAIYVAVDGWCVGVLSAAATQVPCGLRTRMSRLPTPRADHLYLRGGQVWFDDTPVVTGRIHGVRIPRVDHDTAWRSTAGSDSAFPPAPVSGPVVSALAPDAVHRLVGCGPGLTPWGDDVLCGWLALHRSAGVATPEIDRTVRALLARTTLLSATLLDCALHGEAVPQLASYVAALGTPDEERRAEALCAVGHTSGAGLLHGARWALAELDGRLEAAA